MTRYKIIVNPISGRGTGLVSVPLIRQYLDGHKLDYDLVLTERPGHAVDLAQQAVFDGYGVVVGAGGDGTANEVINGLMRAQVEFGRTAAMGMLAVGRGNDFAFSMYVPVDLQQGCQALADGYRKKIDIGWVTGGDYPQGHYFGNGIGVGFDAVVGFVAVRMTRLTGFASYIVAALKTMFLYYKAPFVQLKFEDQTLSLPALMVSVMNGRRLGGGFMLAPNSDNADGCLDLCIVRQTNHFRMLVLIMHFLKGTQVTQKEVTTLRARCLEVTALQGSLPAHADGETLCTEGAQLKIELLPAQLELVCQPHKAVL